MTRGRIDGGWRRKNRGEVEREGSGLRGGQSKGSRIKTRGEGEVLSGCIEWFVTVMERAREVGGRFQKDGGGKVMVLRR